MRPPEAQTGSLLAQAAGKRQAQAVGEQFAGRVGLFLRVDDFEKSRQRMLEHGVAVATEPRDEPYGRFVVFIDSEGNRWDLLGPPHARVGSGASFCTFLSCESGSGRSDVPLSHA